MGLPAMPPPACLLRQPAVPPCRLPLHPLRYLPLRMQGAALLAGTITAYSFPPALSPPLPGLPMIPAGGSVHEAVRQGHDLEGYVAHRFMEATGKKVRRSNFMYYHEKYKESLPSSLIFPQTHAAPGHSLSVLYGSTAAMLHYRGGCRAGM